MSKRKKLLNLCELPDISQPVNTTHCFNDSTHQTCCMLGPKARKYADNTGNPIGKASKKAHKVFKKSKKNNKSKKSKNKKDLTGWCTCIGSNVCAYYAKNFKDGTHIKFINDPQENFYYTNIDPDCEAYVRDLINSPSHLTPGIGNSYPNCTQDKKDKIKTIKTIKNKV